LLIDDSVTIIIRIGVVADPITVGVHRLIWIIRERIGVVAHAIAIRIRGFPRIERKGIKRILNTVAVGIRIGVIADSIAISVRSFLRIKRKSVQGVWRAITVVILIRAIAHTIPVGIEPVASVSRQIVHRIHEAVSVGVLEPLSYIGKLKSHCIQTGHCIRASNSILVLATRLRRFLRSATTGVRIRENMQSLPTATVGHDGCEVVGHIVSSRPTPNTKFTLTKRMPKAKIVA